MTRSIFYTTFNIIYVVEIGWKNKYVMNIIYPKTLILLKLVPMHKKWATQKWQCKLPA